MMVLYFDEVSEGDDLPELQKTVTATQLVRYSGASGDFNPIHTIPDVARSVGLDGVIAHGMLVMGFAGQMLSGWAGPQSLRRFKVRFNGMTVPGEVVICSGKVTRKIADGGEALVSGRLTVRGAADDTIRLKGDFTVALPTR